MAQDVATGQRQLKPSFQKISFIHSVAVHQAPSLQSTMGDRQGRWGPPGDERLRKPQPARGGRTREAVAWRLAKGVQLPGREGLREHQEGAGFGMGRRTVPGGKNRVNKDTEAGEQEVR